MSIDDNASFWNESELTISSDDHNLAGSDHFSRIPDNRPSLMTLFCNKARVSRIVLPVVPRSDPETDS